MVFKAELAVSDTVVQILPKGQQHLPGFPELL